MEKFIYSGAVNIQLPARPRPGRAGAAAYDPTCTPDVMFPVSGKSIRCDKRGFQAKGLGAYPASFESRVSLLSFSLQNGRQ